MARICSVLLLLALFPVGLTPQTSNAHLLLVLDGLRPDYVTADLMPNLYALGQRGVVYTNHHAVYPTVTRVNASSIATGAYPERHGILGNTVFFPRVDAARFLDTAQRAELERIQIDQDGVLLTATTWARRSRRTGKPCWRSAPARAGRPFS